MRHHCLPVRRAAGASSTNRGEMVHACAVFVKARMLSKMINAVGAYGMRPRRHALMDENNDDHHCRAKRTPSPVATGEGAGDEGHRLARSLRDRAIRLGAGHV